LPDTKLIYSHAFKHFIEINVKNDDLQALIDTKQSVIESKIISHIEYLKLKYWSIQVRTAIVPYQINHVRRAKVAPLWTDNGYDNKQSKAFKFFLFISPLYIFVIWILLVVYSFSLDLGTLDLEVSLGLENLECKNKTN
jgi:hypothetical protein